MCFAKRKSNLSNSRDGSDVGKKKKKFFFRGDKSGVLREQRGENRAYRKG